MNIDWLDKLAKKEPDKELKRLSELEEEYKNAFGYNNDFTTALCVDYDSLFKKLENCIKLKIPYHILYKENENNEDYENIDI